MPGDKMDYYHYIKSKDWWFKKQEFRAGCSDPKCFICWDRKSSLDVHHKSYKNLGNERMEDLIFLCEKCHGDLHGRLSIYRKEMRQTMLWNVADVMMREYAKRFYANKEKKELERKFGVKTIVRKCKMPGAGL